jgi:hypothetical protein
MGNKQKGKSALSDAAFDAIFAAATERGKQRQRRDPRAVRVEYHAQSRRLMIELVNGCALLIPVELLQGLGGASDAALAEVKIMPRGLDLHWPQLDVQFTVAGLLGGTFGTKAWMAELGRVGGRAKTEAKQFAARINGAKGGRPRATPVQQKKAAAGKTRRAAA